MDRLLQPDIIGLWVAVGLIVGMIGAKIFHGHRRSGGGTFGSLLRTTVTGMIGSAIGIVSGVLAGIPGADAVGVVMLALAVGGTLLVMLIASRFS